MFLNFLAPRTPLRWFLAVLTVQTLLAQTPAPLKILILEGANAVNSIPNRAATFPVVEVRDENDLPVEGAEVEFTLPPTGAGGLFANQKNTFSGRTNLQGQIRAPYIMNAVPGEFTFQVTATIGTRTGKTLITQTHSMKTPEEMAMKKKSWYKDWRLWAIAGGAATVGIILGTRGGGNSTTAAPPPPVPTITITPGGPSIGGPR